MPITVSGEGDFAAAAARLRAAGQGGLMSHVLKGLKAAAPDLKAAVVTAAGVKLPSGYAPTLIKALEQRAVARGGLHFAAVTMTATASSRITGRQVERLDGGILRHPVFNRRKHPWINQPIPPGFHTATLQDAGPIIEPHLQRALTKALADMTKG